MKIRSERKPEKKPCRVLALEDGHVYLGCMAAVVSWMFITGVNKWSIHPRTINNLQMFNGFRFLVRCLLYIHVIYETVTQHSYKVKH